MAARRERDAQPPGSETPTETTAGQERDEAPRHRDAGSETRPVPAGLARDLVSLLALLAGLAGTVVCLAHLGWWAVGLTASVVTAGSGLLGALRRGEDEAAAQVEHLIEIRHTDEWPVSEE